MSIRLWPQDFERKDHITKAEKALLRYASRNFQNGHMVIGIDPLGLSTDKVKLGMYISPNEGLVTFSIYTGNINTILIPHYLSYVEMVEEKIYKRLLDSKLLIVRNGQNKALKFPYKHIIVFADETAGRTTVTQQELKKLLHYATFESFRPITSQGKEKRIEDLMIFGGIRKAYDKTFKSLSDAECRAIFERLAEEYTVVMNEAENVKVAEKKTLITEKDLRITGREVEYKTFFLDEYQVGIVNDMGKGHRVILANPGAGKSVLLLSKAFKYASLYKGSNVLLTCYNNNLADSYNFKRNCANFGENNNLFIMTFHKLVKKIYEECLHSHCETNVATDEEIQKCIDFVKQGRVNLKFKAIFIDEVQIFDPLYLELCYSLLEDDEDRVFLMAGDLNQAVRALSRKGDAPWKRMNGVHLDFTGRVRYIEKNYRNSKDIGEYISSMLQHMNTRLSMLDLINSLEYEYNSFKIGTNPTIALKVQTGIQRLDIKKQVIAAIKEISTKYKISYSDIAILFPFRQVPYHNYRFLYWLKQGLDEEGIPYSMIINEQEGSHLRVRQGDVSGAVVSTIESSLGLDFKAVVLAGLFPYSYVNVDGMVLGEIKTWTSIKNMPENQQTAVQSQMRAIYTACSRARDVLYVISDLKVGSPMEEIIKKQSDRGATVSPTRTILPPTRSNSVTKSQTTASNSGVASKEFLVQVVVDHVTIYATIQETKKTTTVSVDIEKYPKQKGIIGKRVGDTFKFEGIPLTYKIEKITSLEEPKRDKAPTIATNSANVKSVSKNAPATEKKLSLKAYFESKGFFTIDCRGWDGCLWVLGDQRKLDPYVKEAQRLYGATGAYGSGKQTNYRSAWWTKSNK